MIKESVNIHFLLYFYLTTKQQFNHTPEIPAKLGISGQKGAINYYDKSIIHLPRQYL